MKQMLNIYTLNISNLSLNVQIIYNTYIYYRTLYMVVSL